MLAALQKKKNSPGETEQKNWYIDRYQSVVVQRNLLSIFSLVSLAFSTIAIVLVYFNIPIVTVEPFVIQVEPRSGLTQVVNRQSTVEVSANEAINHYFIVRYIKARENVDGALPYNFETVRLMSEPAEVFGGYAWEIDQRNPESYLARTRGGGTRETKVRAIQKMDNNPNCAESVCTVQVRISVTEGQRGSPAATTLSQIITMEYLFTNVNLSIDQRYINPLGFRVMSYKRVTENL